MLGLGSWVLCVGAFSLGSWFVEDIGAYGNSTGVKTTRLTVSLKVVNSLSVLPGPFRNVYSWELGGYYNCGLGAIPSAWGLRVGIAFRIGHRCNLRGNQATAKKTPWILAVTGKFAATTQKQKKSRHC